MELNNALAANSFMESLTNMSEYFVAANTRTPFTDLAESGSLSSTPNSSTGGGGLGLPLSNQQFSGIGSPTSGLNGNVGGNSSNSKPSPPNHPNSNETQHMQQNHHGSHHQLNWQQNHLHNHQQLHHHHTSSNTMSTIHSSIYNQNHCNTNMNSYSNSSGLGSASSMQQPTRLAQPTRTQIPIHCFIEQLDACADVPGYSSPLDDSDLFNTSNSIHLSNNNNSSNNNGNKASSFAQHHTQPHLLQSKLALESVTNCSELTLSNPSYNGNGSSSLSTASNTLQNDLNNSSSNIDKINDLDGSDLDGLDTNLDLGSTSPLSISMQPTNPQANSIGGLDPFSNRQHSPPYSHQSYQSCRETYAIVTSNVLYIDLVRTVLLQLGYSAMDLINAKGK